MTSTTIINPSGRIFLTALVLGAIGAVACLFGGVLFFPDNNLAPLLSMQAGVLGFCVGIIAGVACSAFSKREQSLKTEFYWLGGLWGALVLAAFMLDCDIVAVSLQALLLLLGTVLVLHQRSQPRLPNVIRRHRLVFFATALLFLLTSLFPPVTHNQWMPVEIRPVYDETNPMPRFVFCADPRLDASRSYAELGVDSNRLLLEWLVIAAGTGLLIAVSHMHNRYNLKPTRNSREVGA